MISAIRGPPCPRNIERRWSRSFPAALATQLPRQLRERVAGQLIPLAFRHKEPAQVCEALRLSVALVAAANPASIMLPGYLLDLGRGPEAVEAAKRALQEWQIRLGTPQPAQRSTFETDPLEAVRHEFLSQAGGDLTLLDSLRDISERRHAIVTLRGKLSNDEFDVLKAVLPAYLRSVGMQVDPASPGIETFPLRADAHARMSIWIVSNMDALRKQLPALDLLRIAHVLQPDFANVNEILADIFFRTSEAGGGEAESFRERARYHAGLADRGMREALASPESIAETGLSVEDFRARHARMVEILDAS